MYCTWKNVNFKPSTMLVHRKPEFNWTPEPHKERKAPIPGTAEWTEVARRKGDCPASLPCCIRTTRRSNAPRTKGYSGTSRSELSGFYMHKFRATFATKCFQSGIDLKTVQQWLGHKNLASTVR
jgi:integrase/recombinase XerD